MAKTDATKPQDATANIDALNEWIADQVPQLMTSGENWKIVLHGRADGDLRYEAARFGHIKPESKLKLGRIRK